MPPLASVHPAHMSAVVWRGYGSPRRAARGCRQTWRCALAAANALRGDRGTPALAQSDPVRPCPWAARRTRPPRRAAARRAPPALRRQPGISHCEIPSDPQPHATQTNHEGQFSGNTAGSFSCPLTVPDRATGPIHPAVPGGEVTLDDVAVAVLVWARGLPCGDCQAHAGACVLLHGRDNAECSG
jgi:hypothetical protein